MTLRPHSDQGGGPHAKAAIALLSLANGGIPARTAKGTGCATDAGCARHAIGRVDTYHKGHGARPGTSNRTPGGDHKWRSKTRLQTGTIEDGECNTDSSLGCMPRRCRGRCVCLCYGLRHAPPVNNLQNPRVTWIDKGREEQQIDGGDQQYMRHRNVGPDTCVHLNEKTQSAADGLCVQVN